MLDIYPKPRAVKKYRGQVDLRTAKRIAVEADISRKLLAHIESWGQQIHRVLTISRQTADDSEQIFLKIARLQRNLPVQGYRLRISDQGMTLTAGDEEGIFYGLQTITQIIANNGLLVPACEISDHPDFKQRGVMLDVSRCKVPTMQTLYQLIDDLAVLKINHLQLYIEHTFAFSNHPLVWQDSSPFTASEICTLVDYCQDRFIDLVPNLNSFGHFERWLRYPEYHRFAECPHGFKHPLGEFRKHGSTLKPGRQSLQLLEELFAEFLPNFASTAFNVGADEPWELGQGWSKKRCAEIGRHQVYLDFLRGIGQLAAKHNRDIMFWGDILLEQPHLLDQTPEHSTALIWGYEARHPFARQCQNLAESQLEFYVCPGTSSWNSLTGRSENARKNLANAARNGLRYGAEGYLITDWGDHGHHQYLPISYPGLLLGACYSWCMSANRHIDAASGVSSVFFGNPEDNMGQIIWELGRVLELADSSIRNATVFNQLLFWQLDDDPDYMRGIQPIQLANCLNRFSELQVQLHQCGTSRPDTEIIRDEIDNAIDMARHGIHRYQLYQNEIKDRGTVRRELQHLIPRHERLWLARNRIGGLHESSGRLRNSLKALE